ncbi:hypothetical protein EIK77_002667 [Talaromyces pinophilus]|nr:hypothetical protein EIK77_002667 [Talaromyces pinophilus]
MRYFKIVSCYFCMFVTMATSSINTPTHSAGEANNSPVIPQDSLSSAIDSNEVGTDKVNNEQDKKVEVDSSPPPTTERGAQFWAIIATLCVIGLLSALENTVVTTSFAAIQPLFGQLANIFGRRWVTMAIVAFFTLGSGIAGGASNGAMLIAGRAIQGVGSGGINMIVDVIVSDLVPLRERGNYMAFVLILLGRIQDPQVTAMFINGAAYQHATAAFLNSFSEPTKDQLIGVYTESLKRVWEIAIVFSGVAFLLVFIEKEIKLRTELDTDFGLETENTADVETAEKTTSEVD